MIAYFHVSCCLLNMDRMKSIILQIIVLASFGSSFLMRSNHDFAFRDCRIISTTIIALFSTKQKWSCHEPFDHAVLHMQRRQRNEEGTFNDLLFERRTFLDKFPHVVFCLGVILIPRRGDFSRTVAMEEPLECRDGALMAGQFPFYGTLPNTFIKETHNTFFQLYRIGNTRCILSNLHESTRKNNHIEGKQ